MNNLKAWAQAYIIVFWSAVVLALFVCAFYFAWPLGVGMVLWTLLIAACMIAGDDE
jgi:hypothetical protein